MFFKLLIKLNFDFNFCVLDIVFGIKYIIIIVSLVLLYDIVIEYLQLILVIIYLDINVLMEKLVFEIRFKRVIRKDLCFFVFVILVIMV